MCSSAAYLYGFQEEYPLVDSNSVIDSVPHESHVFGILFEHGSEAVFTLHRETRQVLSANDRLADLIGRSREDLVDQRADDLFINDDMCNWVDRIFQRAGLHEEVAMRRLDEYPIYVALTVAHIEPAQSGPIAACIARDTTERRKLERQLISKHAALHQAHVDLEKAFTSLRETKASLEARNRELSAMGAELANAAHRAALGEFSAGIAHSMNNPMAAISSSLRQVIKRVEGHHDDSLKTELERFFARSQNALGRMQNIVNTIRTAHKSGNLDSQPRVIKLADEIGLTLALFEHRSGDVEVICNIPSDTCAFAPSDALHHVSSNLIDNAIRAVGQQGQVEITTRTQDDNIVLSVADSGPGVPPEILDTIFDPFVTKSTDGTGLGLCMARRLARRWGGDVVHVETPTGARFEVTLPAKETKCHKVES